MYSVNKWILAIVALVIIGAFVRTYGPLSSGTKGDEVFSQQGALSGDVIEMTKEGFAPQNIVIPVGTTVRFVNSDSEPHWPASGARPDEDVCPGFDSFRPIVPGEFYEFTFKEVKICPMHDQLNPSFTGIITVGNFQ